MHSLKLPFVPGREKSPICYLFGASPSGFAFTPSKRPQDYWLALDGGFKRLQEQKKSFAVDMVLGDFDSYLEASKTNVSQAYTDRQIEQLSNAELRKMLGLRTTQELIHLPIHKDLTDMEAALHWALALPCDPFILLGATGGRLDHTLANIQCLKQLAHKQRHVIVIDSGYQLAVLDPTTELTINEAKHTRLSLFALSDEVAGLNITGTEYEAQNLTLSNDKPLAISNQILTKDVRISLKKGYVLVYLETQPI